MTRTSGLPRVTAPQRGARLRPLVQPVQVATAQGGGDEGVAQGVGRNFFHYTGQHRIFFNDPLHRAGSEAEWFFARIIFVQIFSKKSRNSVLFPQLNYCKTPGN